MISVVSMVREPPLLPFPLPFPRWVASWLLFDVMPVVRLLAAADDDPPCVGEEFSS